MSVSRPDKAAVDAWLKGDLGEKERAAVEMWIDKNPDEFLARDDDLINEALLKGITSEKELDPELTHVIDLVTGLPKQIESLGKNDWKKILTPSENQEHLGVLGGYEVMEVIATGGMGIVFKARDPELQRFAALKVLSPDLATIATARVRFLREARAAANLEQDNILPIYHVNDDGVPWFAMRYAEGGTLQDRLDGGGEISINELKSIAHQASLALAAAHDRGLIHRDIKPANLLFDKSGKRLWVCDFGIVRSTGDPGLTYPGTIAGTPQYMSPEQADGTIELDGRSDLYSLGAVLYRCATGEHFTPGDTAASVLEKLKSGSETAMVPAVKALPRWFQRLLANLLAPDREDRPRDAHAVVKNVEAEFSPRPRHSERRKRTVLQGFATVGVVSAIAFGLLQIPAIQSALNQMLAIRHEQTFLIAGKIGAFPGLEEAIEAAESGDEILLPVGKLITVGNLQIGSEKEMRFRSVDEGGRPRITAELPGIRGFVSESSLSFRGVDFELKAKNNGDGIIMMHNGTLLLEDCNFVARREVKKPYKDTKSRTIELFSGANATIHRCQFDLQHGNVLTLHEGGSHVVIHDSEMTAFFGMNTLISEKQDVETILNMERSSFRGEHLVKISVHKEQVPLFSCQMRGNQYQFTSSVCWIQFDDLEKSRGRFFWNDSDSQMLSGDSVIAVGYARHRFGADGTLLPLGRKGAVQKNAESR